MFWFICLYNHCIFACYSECKHTYRIVLTTGVGRCQEISYKTNNPLKQSRCGFEIFYFWYPGIRNHCDNHNYHQSTSNLILVFLKTWSDCKLPGKPFGCRLLRNQAWPKLRRSATVGKSGDERRWKVMASCGEATPRWNRHMSCLEAERKRNRKNQPNWKGEKNHLNDPPTICLGSMLIFQGVYWFPCFCVKTLGNKTGFARNSTKFCYRR